jgi:hypothetical protein
MLWNAIWIIVILTLAQFHSTMRSGIKNKLACLSECIIWMWKLIFCSFFVQLVRAAFFQQSVNDWNQVQGGPTENPKQISTKFSSWLEYKIWTPNLYDLEGNFVFVKLELFFDTLVVAVMMLPFPQNPKRNGQSVFLEIHTSPWKLEIYCWLEVSQNQMLLIIVS